MALRISCVPRRVVIVRFVAFTCVAFRLTAADSEMYVASEQSSQHTLAICLEDDTGTLYIAYTGDASRLVALASNDRDVHEFVLEISCPVSVLASSLLVAFASDLGLGESRELDMSDLHTSAW